MPISMDEAGEIHRRELPKERHITFGGHRYVLHTNLTRPPEAIQAPDDISDHNFLALHRELVRHGFGIIPEDVVARDVRRQPLQNELVYYRDEAFDGTSLERLVEVAMDAYPHAFDDLDPEITLVDQPAFGETLDQLLVDPRFSDVAGMLENQTGLMPK